MSETTITERQQHWLNHIKAADSFDGSVADYARAEGLTPKELYQWKTVLTRRGLLPGKKIRSDFVAVATTPVRSSVVSLLLFNQHLCGCRPLGEHSLNFRIAYQAQVT